MKTFRIAAGLALAVGMATAGSLGAAQEHPDGKKYDKGATVTLQGCVIAGEKKAGRPNKDDIPITLLKVKVEELKMVSSSCPITR
jgi:hypothetical protein